MFEFSVSKDMDKLDIIREVAVGKVGSTFMSNTHCQAIEN